MKNIDEELKKNEILAQQINKEARTNPKVPYAGKYVGIVGGQVVAVMDTLDEVVEALEKIELNPDRGMVIEASADYDRTHYIWREY